MRPRNLAPWERQLTSEQDAKNSGSKVWECWDCPWGLIVRKSCKLFLFFELFSGRVLLDSSGQLEMVGACHHSRNLEFSSEKSPAIENVIDFCRFWLASLGCSLHPEDLPHSSFGVLHTHSEVDHRSLFSVHTTYFTVTTQLPFRTKQWQVH